MRIVAIDTIPVRVPIHPERAIMSAIAKHDASPFLLVRVRTDEDIVGLGEVSCTPFWSGEDQVTAAHMIRTYLEPVLLGMDPTQVERATAIMDRALFGSPFTKAGIEMALWDILGKAAGMPLYRLLGGPIGPERIPTKFSISGTAPDEAARIAAWAAEAGFRAMKVKVGLDPQEDVERVAAVRRQIGPDVKLGVDANGGWSSALARRIIPRLEEQDISFVEQPIPAGDPHALSELRRTTTLPIIADESVTTPAEAFALARDGAADVLSIYVGKGGIGPARRIAAVARAAGLCCTVGSNLELGTAAAAMIHLAAAAPGVNADDYPCDILTPFYYPCDLLASPLDIRAGSASPPEAPGLGVEWDEAAIRKFTA